MTPNMVVHMARFDSLLRELSAVSRKTIGQIIKARAGTMARYLAESTMPVGRVSTSTLSDGRVVEQAVGLNSIDAGEISGTGPAIRALGRNAVLRDLNRVYMGASRAFASISDKKLARAAYAAIKQQRWDEMRARLKGAGVSVAALTSEPWDSGARHRKSRNSRGRVNSGTKPVIVSDTRALADYVRNIAGTPTRGGRVGLAKSGFVRASYLITGKWPRGTPAWMRLPAPASASDNTHDAHNPRITFTNLLRYADEALPDRQYSAAIMRLERALIRDMEIQLQKQADKLLKNQR